MRKDRSSTSSPPLGPFVRSARSLLVGFVLAGGLFALGCSDANGPTGVEPAETEPPAPPVETIPAEFVTCSNGQTFITMCVNPDANPQTISVHLKAARKLAAQGAWLGPCPGETIIDRCN
ncbi:MAG: hypothetical protein R3266_11265 [Gemmatimonadota bacterium]|nr:hypothetical protein [Gemmatimonadota bacterium]